MRTWPLVLLAAVAGLALAVAGWAAWQLLEGPAGRGQRVEAESTLPELGGPFSLVDHHGHPVTDKDFRGRWMLIYFGYTYCPDVCPTSLIAMGQALDSLGAAAEQVQPIFITIDPKRDTVEVLADYVRNFHPRLIGLTGSPEQIAKVAKAYRVYYAKSDAKAQGGDAAVDYLMDHSSQIYLMGPQGRLRTLMGHSTGPKEMAAKIRKAMAEAR